MADAACGSQTQFPLVNICRVYRLDKNNRAKVLHTELRGTVLFRLDDDKIISGNKAWVGTLTA